MRNHFKLFAFIVVAILHSAFFILHSVPAVHASSHPLPPLNPFCFRQEECPGALYQNGRPAVSQECQNQDQRWVSAGYSYYCYAPEPTVDLQVSVGGYQVTGLGNYIRRFYVYAVSIAGIVAGFIIIWAGVKWLLSAGNPERITDARRKLSNALVGLFLILGSYVILQTVNPSLVNLRPPPVKMVRQELSGGEICVNREQYPCGGLRLDTPLAQEPLGMWRVNPAGDLGGRDGLAPGGRFTCNDSRIPNLIQNPPCPSGPGTQGTCLAQFCPFTGCFDLTKDRIRPDAGRILEGVTTPEQSDEAVEDPGFGSFERAGVQFDPADGVYGVALQVQRFRQAVDEGQRICVKPEQCGNCAEDVPWAVCVSSACNCTLGVRQTGPRAGQVVCMPPISGGIEPGFIEGLGARRCSAHSQCASGRCNFAKTPNACIPIGGERAGELCDEGAACAQGLLCNEGYTEGSYCQPPQPYGEPCAEDRDCQSGDCDLSFYTAFQTGCCRDEAGQDCIL